MSVEVPPDMRGCVPHGRPDSASPDPARAAARPPGPARGRAGARAGALAAAAAASLLLSACTSPLVHVAVAGDAKATRQLIESGGFTADATDVGGRSVLSVAVMHDQVEVVRVLLEEGADPNRIDPDGRSPLLWASQRGNTAMVRALVAGGANVEIRNRDTRATPLIEAAWAGEFEAARALLDAGAKPNVTEQERSGGTALHVAILRGDSRLAGLLLDRGADPTVVDRRGRTATRLAKGTRRRQITAMIAARSAKPTRESAATRRPPSRPSAPARRDRRAEPARPSAEPAVSLRERDRRFYRALRTGDLPAVDRGLSAGIAVDGWNFEGMTPLEWAIVLRQEQVVALLVEHGADVDRVGAHGRRPLHHAIHARSRPVAQTLVLNGADLDASEAVNGASPLVEAVWRGETDIVKLLLASGADPDVRERGRSGGAALHAAVQADREEMLELLLAAGADPTILNREGRSALAEAERLRRTHMAALIRVSDTPTAGSGPSRRPAPRFSRPSADRPSEPAPDEPGGWGPAEEPRRWGRAAERYGSAYSRRVAAVIGVDRYRSWPSLEGARADAERFAATLRELGFDEVIEVYDEDATRSRILQLLGTELVGSTGREDLAVIFFAGHGHTETLPGGEKRGYVIPSDAEHGDAFSTAISMTTLRDLSNRLPAKHVYYAMDSCYSGLGFVRGISVPVRSQGYFEKMTSLRAVQMVTAGAEGEQVYERGGKGLFTTYLIRAMQGQADLDGDGSVTASEIGAYVKPQVSAASSYRQTPQFGTLEGTGEIVFRLR